MSIVRAGISLNTGQHHPFLGDEYLFFGCFSSRHYLVLAVSTQFTILRTSDSCVTASSFLPSRSLSQNEVACKDAAGGRPALSAGAAEACCERASK